MPEDQELLGPETITINKIDSTKTTLEKVNFKDNQQKAWNCSDAEIIPHLKEGLTVDVWYTTWSPPDGSFTSKYIKQATLSRNAPQELREPFKPSAGGPGGGGSRGGGGKKGDGDYRTSGENIVQEALDAASRIMASLAPSMVNIMNGEIDQVLTKIRVETSKMTEVFAELVREKGQQMGRSDAAASAGSKPAQQSWGESGGAAGGGSGGSAWSGSDDDIPFGDGPPAGSLAS